MLFENNFVFLYAECAENAIKHLHECNNSIFFTINTKKTMKIKLWMMLMLFAALTMSSCGSDDSDSKEPDNPSFVPDYEIDPEPGFENLSEAKYDEMLADFVTRVIYLCISPDASYNDVELIDHYLNGFAYKQVNTRGIWGQMKAVYDFAKVMNDANVLHRTVLVGAMANYGFKSSEQRAEIWRDIRASGCLPAKYNSMGSNEFWKEFSLGNMDKYAREVYNAVMEKADAIGANRNVTGDLAAAMADNKLRHIDLTMTIAPKLLEAGTNIVFAFGDDIISNGQLAYDFVNKNGELVLEIMDGNMTSETCLEAVNNNLKLMSNALLEEVVPTTGDLKDLLSDMTFEQIKALNQEIEDLVKSYGDMRISNDDLGLFVDRAREILGVYPWEMNFSDLIYQAKDKTEFEIVTNDGKAYTFYYTTEDEEVLLEAKCSVSEHYINVRVEYLDDRCDLLPRGASEGDVYAIPYRGYANYPDPPGRITLWWQSNQHAYKDFERKKEDVFEGLHFYCNFNFNMVGEVSTQGRAVRNVNFTSDQMTMTKGKESTYTLVAEKDTQDSNDLVKTHRTLKITYKDLGLNDKRKPVMSDIIEMEYHEYPLGDPVIWEGKTFDHFSLTLKDLWFDKYNKDSNSGFELSEWLEWTNREFIWKGGKEEVIYHPFTVTNFTFYETYYPYDAKNKRYKTEERYTLSGQFASNQPENQELSIEAFIVDNRSY